MRLDIRIQPWYGSVYGWFGKSISFGFLFCGVKRNLAPDFKGCIFSLLTQADPIKEWALNILPVCID